MKIALIGYGKMGKSLDRLATQRGHEVTYKIDSFQELQKIDPEQCDVCIEFSDPGSAFHTISWCIENGLKVISGTTGWLEEMPNIVALTEKHAGTFLHSSNFSTGVNIFFELNQFLAEKMKSHPKYQLQMEEIHHTEKLDSPSGTAIRLAEGILAANKEKIGWINEKTTDQTKIGIVSHREPNVPGTHTVEYVSEFETIEIKHTAHNRDVFASGALDVAEWIQDKSGVLTMSDYLKAN